MKKKWHMMSRQSEYRVWNCEHFFFKGNFLYTNFLIISILLLNSLCIINTSRFKYLIVIVAVWLSFSILPLHSILFISGYHFLVPFGRWGFCFYSGQDTSVLKRISYIRSDYLKNVTSDILLTHISVLRKTYIRWTNWENPS